MPNESHMKRTFTLPLLALLMLTTACTQPATIEQVVGKDKDEHGCKGSAGYTWSTVLHDCIRLWEAGVRIRSGESSGFLIYSADSTFAEVFLPDGQTVICRRKKGEADWHSRSGVHVWTNNGVTVVRTRNCTYTAEK